MLGSGSRHSGSHSHRPVPSASWWVLQGRQEASLRGGVLSRVRVHSWLPLPSVLLCLFQQFVTGAISTDLSDAPVTSCVCSTCRSLTSPIYFLLWLVRVFSRLFCVLWSCCALCLLTSVSSYPRMRREKDFRSLSSSTLRWFTWAHAGSLLFQLVGPHLAADRSYITPETARHYQLFLLCTLSE